MFEKPEVLTLASSLAAHAAERQSAIARNVANADTPGYRRKTVSFEAEMARGAETGRVEVGRVRLDRTDLQRIYDPENPLADATGHYDGSNVNLLVEVADAREAQRSYEANLKVFDQVRQMSTALMDLLRR